MSQDTFFSPLIIRIRNQPLSTIYMALLSRRAYAPFIQVCRDYHQYHMNQVPRLFSSAVKVTTHTNTNDDDKQYSRLENLRTQLTQEDSSLHEFASTTEPTIGNINRKKAPPRPAKILPVRLISNTTISFCCNRILTHILYSLSYSYYITILL